MTHTEKRDSGEAGKRSTICTDLPTVGYYSSPPPTPRPPYPHTSLMDDMDFYIHTYMARTLSAFHREPLSGMWWHFYSRPAGLGESHIKVDGFLLAVRSLEHSRSYLVLVTNRNYTELRKHSKHRLHMTSRTWDCYRAERGNTEIIQIIEAITPIWSNGWHRPTAPSYEKGCGALI